MGVDTLSKTRSTTGQCGVAVLRGSEDKPWVVCCNLCSRSISSGFVRLFGTSGPTSLADGIRWAHEWWIAQDFAQKHAAEHEAQRCGTCGHRPSEPLPEYAPTPRPHEPEPETSGEA